MPKIQIEALGDYHTKYQRPTWLDPELVKALDSVVSAAVGTMANEFKANESDIEPKKSTSELLAEVGAAVQDKKKTKMKMILYVLLFAYDQEFCW